MMGQLHSLRAEGKRSLTSPEEDARTDAIVYRRHQSSNVEALQPFLLGNHLRNLERSQLGACTRLDLRSTLDYFDLWFE